jgi:SHS2 domain-containing protein
MTVKYDWIIMPQHQTWEHFAHQADIGIRGTGATLAEAFEQAACALTAVITNPDAVRATRAVEIQCEAGDPELLLVDWLNAIIYEMAVQHLLFSRFEVQTDGQRLSGCAWGEAIDIPRHQPAVEVKGATFTELKVTQEGGGRWIAQCIVDV